MNWATVSILQWGAYPPHSYKQKHQRSTVSTCSTLSIQLTLCQTPIREVKLYISLKRKTREIGSIWTQSGETKTGLCRAVDNLFTCVQLKQHIMHKIRTIKKGTGTETALQVQSTQYLAENGNIRTATTHESPQQRDKTERYVTSSLQLTNPCHTCAGIATNTHHKASATTAQCTHLPHDIGTRSPLPKQIPSDGW
jgi:hypothetical protein